MLLLYKGDRYLCNHTAFAMLLISPAFSLLSFAGGFVYTVLLCATDNLTGTRISCF